MESDEEQSSYCLVEWPAIGRRVTIKDYAEIIICHGVGRRCMFDRSVGVFRRRDDPFKAFLTQKFV